MGQIVIDIPNGSNRRYVVEKADDARKLVRVLDEVLRNTAKLTRHQKQGWRVSDPGAIAVPICLWHHAELTLREAVQFKPDGPETLCLHKIIGRHKCLHDIAAAFYPQQIFEIDTGQACRAWIETAC